VITNRGGAGVNLFLRKSIDDLVAESNATSEHGLRRVLGPINLISLGVGAIIGTGIFVLIGTAAARYAGPAIIFSILLAGFACALAGLCYAEFASMIPMAGSAYTYGYATLGEFFAWIIGWDLMLEYLFSAATVAVGWSGWVTSLMRDLGLALSPEWSNAPGLHLVQTPGSAAWVAVTDQLAASLAKTGVDITTLPHATGVLNVPAMIGVLLVTTLLAIGIQESARVNNTAVFIKVSIVLTFIALGVWFIAGHHDVAATNWHPFVPPNTGEFGHFGWSGVLRGAGVIFFAYIGFDAVSTTAQEAKNPQRDMPIGMLGSLVICTVLYILVSGVVTGIVPYAQLDVPEPIALAVERMGFGTLAMLMKIGVVAGLTSVMLVTLLGQTRVFYAMSKDGLLPSAFSTLHRRFRTPFGATWLTGVACALIAGLLPLALLGELVSIGTLLAFVVVCAGVLYLRRKEPDRPRPFRTPMVPLVPVLGIITCVGMMLGLPHDTWIRLAVWLIIGFVIYFGYSRHHSVLQRDAAQRG
jgi:APA family basic amino acid/polyamine antiporter